MQKIVVAENIKTIREGIKIFIDRFSNFECTESFSDLESLYKNLSEIQPDMLLMDINLNGIQNLNEIKSLKKNYPHLTIVVLTMSEENDNLFGALLNGASAYINKNSPSLRIIKALEDISRGKILVNSLVARKTINYLVEKKLTENYSERDIALLMKIIEGNNLKAIEKSLSISKDEIMIIFHDIYQKIHTLKSGDFNKLKV